MPTGRIREVISFVFFIYVMLVIVFKLPFYFGYFFSTPQLLAVSLFSVMVLHLIAGKKGQTRHRWLDAVPLIVGLPGLIFIAFFYEMALDYEGYGFLDAKGIFFSFSLAASLVVLVFRRTGWAMPTLIVGMLLLVRFQNHLPGLLHGKGYEFSRLGFSFYLGTHGIFGVPFKIATSVLISFIVFGRLFQASGGGAWFLSLSSWLLGSAPGGIAKVSVLGSAFFGMISGSPSANTASTGAITIPMMVRSGYKPSVAGAIESVSSTGGQFMPPVMGAIIFIMAEWLEVSYSSVALKAALPAILYYMILFSTIHFEALKSGRKVTLRADTTPIGQLLKEGWVYGATFVALIVFLLVFELDPEVSVFYSLPILIAGSFFTGKKEQRLTPRKLYNCISEAVATFLTVAAVTAAVGMLIGALTLSGLGVKISGFLINLSSGNLVFLLVLVGLASFILGMGLDSIPCYMTVAVLTAPALMQTGVSDMAAHLFVIYWGMASFFTPPVCIAVYVACGISGASVSQTGLHAVRLGVGVFLVPFAFVLHPPLLLDGAFPMIVLTALLAVVAAVSIGCGSSGYCLRSLNIYQRGLLVAGALTLILPSSAAMAGGLAMMAVSLAWQWRQNRQEAVLMHS